MRVVERKPRNVHLPPGLILLAIAIGIAIDRFSIVRLPIFLKKVAKSLSWISCLLPLACLPRLRRRQGR